MGGAFTHLWADEMLEAHARAGIRNRLLNMIGLEDWDLVGPHLESVSLRDRQVIEVPTKPITHAYFLETGVASVVAVDSDDHRSAQLLTHWCETQAPVSPTRCGGAHLEFRRCKSPERVHAVLVAEDAMPGR